MDFYPDLATRELYWTKFLGIGTTDPIMRDLAARELFETTFGIHNHDNLDATNPFPLVTYHATRPKNWTKREHIKTLLEEDMPRRTGMSLTELLFETDVDTYNAIVESVDSVNQAEAKHAASLGDGKTDLEAAIFAMRNK